jgi:plasmid stability protein
VKNITVSVDEETYRLSRIRAAESGTSVSALVREFLTRLTQTRTHNPEFDQLQKLQDELIDSIHKRGAGLHSSENLPRNSLYH